MRDKPFIVGSLWEVELDYPSNDPYNISVRQMKRVDEGDNMEENTQSENRGPINQMVNNNKMRIQHLEEQLQEQREANIYAQNRLNQQESLLMAASHYKDASTAAIDFAERAFDLQRQLDNRNKEYSDLMSSMQRVDRENSGLREDMILLDHQYIIVRNERERDSIKFAHQLEEGKAENERLLAEVRSLRAAARKKVSKK